MKPERLDPFSLPDLLYAARGSGLKSLDLRELKGLVSALEDAVETARVAAIHRVLESGLLTDARPNAPTQFDFAILFAALRRARAEGKRREAAMPHVTQRARHAG